MNEKAKIAFKKYKLELLWMPKEVDVYKPMIVGNLYSS